ncbi:hypothetical protein B7R74_16945 [Yersinia pseudotuberculosis]|uniref:Uncharacterized protein n=1 Tax=Yersinia pseudotuberculosis TaxID=633 RepID=A0A0T9JTK2_YERPU|nr:hypothetical protein [Yersinia pseudotuberculosis]PSH16406.1 hypothetical protein B7R74_16945 [Yersinia pseudotuberculosis]CND31113.1 Uncharacterised protein [Yersinia pseudotuberculosis]SUP82296.1 Uncharacterised protein [Yersinia pseudotuberculosis]
MKIVLLAFILMWSGFVSSAENLGLTIEEFHGQLNSELQEANNAFDFNLVKNIKIKNGKTANVAQIKLNGSNKMIATADKNSKMVKELTNIFIPNGDPLSAAISSLFIDATLMKMFSPEIPEDEREQLINELIYEVISSPDKKGQYIADEVTYNVMGTNGLGLWFIVTPNK